MKLKFYTLSFIMLFVSVLANAQFKEYKAGHEFYISFPDYMTKTLGINDAASIQFKNTVKDVYGFVIEDTKEDLALVELGFTSIKEFYDYFIKDFLVEEINRKVSEPTTKKVGKINFIESEATFTSKEDNEDIYYFVGVVETKTSFYKVLFFCNAKDKDKYKADFQKALYSLRD